MKKNKDLLVREEIETSLRQLELGDTLDTEEILKKVKDDDLILSSIRLVISEEIDLRLQELGLVSEELREELDFSMGESVKDIVAEVKFREV